MRKLIIAGLLLTSSVVLAAPKPVNFSIYRASYTATNETAAEIQQGNQSVDFLHAVIISSATTGGVLKLYDSQGSASSLFALIDLSAKNDFAFDVWLSSGLTYTTSGNSNGVTIIYRK